MKIQQFFIKCLDQIRDGIKFYLRIFYDPTLYRDIAFRESGYGLQRVFILIFILMLPSFTSLYKQTVNLYEQEWITELKTLPHLKLENNKLIQFNQDIRLSSKIDGKVFQWFNKTRIEEGDDIFKHPTQFLLGINYLWVQLPINHRFGYLLSKNITFIPLLSWGILKEPITGEKISEIISFKYIFNMILIYSLTMFMVNCFLIFFFIRTFSFVAKKMVLLVLKDALEYKLTCRLLSVSIFPCLTCLAVFIDLWGFKEYYKYLFTAVYMFNFYIAIRCIKARSSFRWISGFK